MSGTVEGAGTTVQAELEKAADVIFSGEAVEGMEHLADEAPALSDVAPAPVEGEQKPAEGVAPADGDQKPADGAAPADDEQKPAEGAVPADGDQKPADGVAPAEGAKKDDLDLTPPEGMSKRSSERWERLTGALKEKDTQITQMTTEVSGLREQVTSFKALIDSSGLNDNELLRVIDLGAQIKRDPEGAFRTLNGVLKNLAKQIGHPIETVDLLEGFPDLQTKIKNLDITRDAALEIARGRLREQSQRTREQTAERTRAAENDAATRVSKAAADVEIFLTSSEAGDPDFARLVPALTRAAKFARENIAPEKWLDYLKHEVENLKGLGSTPGAGRRAPETPTPLTDDSAGRGTKAKEVRTLGDLADQLL